jgi:hypothetical protein
MTTELSKAQLKRVGKMAEAVTDTLEELFSEDLHVKRIESLGNATVGLLASAKAGVHAIGIGLAHVRGVLQKHAIKQVDRLFSNEGIDTWKLFALWVPYMLAQRVEAVVALDWTDFDADGQTTLALSLITSHGRATPLVWKTVPKKELAGQRANIEDQVIERFLEVAPSDIRLTLLADRGFADQALFAKLDEWKMHYVIRMRGNVVVESDGDSRKGNEWVAPHGRAVKLRGARITKDRTLVPAVVCIRAAKMKQAWVLVTNRTDLTASEIVKAEGLRSALHYRRVLPRPEGPALRLWRVPGAYQHARAARPPALRRGAGDRDADLAGRGRRHARLREVGSTASRSSCSRRPPRSRRSGSTAAGAPRGWASRWCAPPSRSGAGR